MTVDRLARIMENPEFLRQILGSVASRVGSVGVALDPVDKSKAAVKVHLTGDEPSPLPEVIEIEGDSVKVITTIKFSLPIPQRR